MRSSSFWMSSPAIGCTSMPCFSASSRKAASFRVRTNPLVRNAGRREERTAHLLRGEQKLQHLPVLAAPGVVENGRDVRNLRMFFQRHLEQDVDLLLLQPVDLAQLEEGPADAAKSLGLPALHGQKDLGAAGITGDDSELRPQ